MRWEWMLVVGVVGCGARAELGADDEDVATTTTSTTGTGGSGGRYDPPPPACDLAPPLVVFPGGEMPAPTRVAGRAFYLRDRDEVLVVGGLRGSGDYTPDAVRIDADGDAQVVGYVGSSPQGWTGADVGRTPDGSRFFVVGGTVVGSMSDRAIELRYDGSALSVRELPRYPHTARGAAVGYDPSRRRIVVFGGYDGTGGAQFFGDTWVLEPDAPTPMWVELTAGGPEPQEDAHMIHVPTIGMVMWASRDGYERSELWVMAQGTDTWRPITLSETVPFGNRPSVVFDPGSCQLVVWGGSCTGPSHLVDLVDDPGGVTPFVPNLGQPRVFTQLAFDPRRRRFLLHGGYDCGVNEFLPSSVFLQ